MATGLNDLKTQNIGGMNYVDWMTAQQTALKDQALPLQQFDFQKEQFAQQDARRQQMLDLLGLNTQTMGSGGLLGGTFFQSILGNTLPNVVGGITSNLPTGGGSGQLGQPGFADSPSADGTPSSGGGSVSGGGSSLFDQLLSARGQLGRDVLGDISRFGNSRRNEIDRDFQNVGNSALARLDARGLGSSNLGASTMLGVERGRQSARGQLEDQLLSQQIGAKQQIGEGLFGDVGAEMNRGVERQRIGASLLNALVGGAFNTVSL